MISTKTGWKRKPNWDGQKCPSINRIREAFDYNHKTGLVRWKIYVYSGKNRIMTWPGKLVTGDQAHLDCHTMQIYRMCWAHYYGYYSTCDDMDHEDRDHSNNRIKNLRESSTSQNHMNSKLRSDNTSGYKGVSFEDRRGKWVARIYVRGKNISLGRFMSMEEAIAARIDGEKIYHGKFAAKIDYARAA